MFKKNNRGFTLLEVLIALFILAVGILGVATMQISAIQGNSRGRQISEATNVASGLMESLLALDYNDACLLDVNDDGAAGLNNLWGNRDLPNGACPAVPADVPDGYNLFWNIAVDDPRPGTKTIRVFVEAPQTPRFAIDTIRNSR